jgi:hypothetical protein
MYIYREREKKRCVRGKLIVAYDIKLIINADLVTFNVIKYYIDDKRLFYYCCYLFDENIFF